MKCARPDPFPTCHTKCAHGHSALSRAKRSVRRFDCPATQARARVCRSECASADKMARAGSPQPCSRISETLDVGKLETRMTLSFGLTQARTLREQVLIRRVRPYAALPARRRASRPGGH